MTYGGRRYRPGRRNPDPAAWPACSVKGRPMGSLFERITDWIKEGLIEAITGQYTGIFDSVNDQVADVAGQVGQTPQGWNGGVFSMIQNLSETVVIPIAGMILTFVLVYEPIQMILEKNNMHDFDTFNIFKWIF